MRDKIEAFARDNIDSMLEDIEAMVAIPSVRGEPQPGMPFGQGPAQALARMEQIVKKHGFAAENIDNYMLTVSLNDKPDALGILCHLDVVHEGEGWATPAFEMDIRDGNIYGRGTADNKGPAMAALYAMKCVRELGAPLSGNVRLMLGTDVESGGSDDLKAYFQRKAPPPYCFSPDAAFPVYNVEKGRFACGFTAVYAESGKLPRVLSVEGGLAVNIVPSSAGAVLQGISRAQAQPYLNRCSDRTGVAFETGEEGDRLHITATGAGAHATYPQEGNNALTALLELLADMPFAESAGFQRLCAVGALLPHGDFYGKALGVDVEQNPYGPLTCSLGTFRYSPTGLSGAADVRYPLCTGVEAVSGAIEREFSARGLRVSLSGMVMPHHVPEDLPFIRVLLNAYEAYTGKKGECVSMGGGTYVHGMKNSVAFGPSFPETVTNAHAADEHAVISELEACVKIFAQVILDMCTEESVE